MNPDVLALFQAMVKEQAGIIATNTEVIKANTEQTRQITETMAYCKAHKNG